MRAILKAQCSKVATLIFSSPFKLTSGISPREMCSATVLNGIVGKAIQSSVYSDITEHAQHIAFALKTLPDIFKQNGRSVTFFVTKVNLNLHLLEQLSNDC